MFYLKYNPKFFYMQKKAFSCGKSVLFFWIDFTNVLSILQKSKITNNLITILGYSSGKNIIAKNIILID